MYSTHQSLQRLIDSTGAQIDALVYGLHGLTAEEIAVVEGAVDQRALIRKGVQHDE